MYNRIVHSQKKPGGQGQINLVVGRQNLGTFAVLGTFCGGEESLGCPCVLRKLLVGKGRLSGKSPSSHRQVTESPQDAAIKSPRLHIIIQSVPKEASGPKLGRVKSHSTGRAPRRVGSDSHSTAPCPLGASSLARPTGAKFKCQAPTRSSLIQAGVNLT